MPKALPTLAEFLAGLPDDRRETVTTLHKAIRKAVPKLKPTILFGMRPQTYARRDSRSGCSHFKFSVAIDYSYLHCICSRALETYTALVIYPNRRLA